MALTGGVNIVSAMQRFPDLSKASLQFQLNNAMLLSKQ